MKEQGVDGAVVGGFKTATDGWHVIEFQEGIDFMKGKGGEGIWQDEHGNKAYNFPLKVKNADDPDDGAQIGYTAFTKGGGDGLASVLVCAGLWDAVLKAFPDPNISVFDEKVMNGVKSKLPGRSCMCRSQVDKGGFSKAVQFATFAKYKEIEAETKKKGGGKKSEAPAAETKPSAPADEWG